MSRSLGAVGRPPYRVLIVGCGELGSRHLQAVAALPEVREIDVVDPRPEALDLGQRRLAEVADPATGRVRWLPSLTEAAIGGDLCIVATRADVRRDVVRTVTETLGYSSFLLEKLVAPSVKEYEQLMGLCNDKGVAAWVNCKTRAYPFHQRVKRLLDPAEPILFAVIGGNHGLATNGVHDVDLFAFYDGATKIESGGSRIDSVLHPSKRGDGLFDLSGTLQGYTEKGSRFTLSYAKDHIGPGQICIATCRYRCIVDHLQRWAVESDAASGWGWRTVPFEGDILVSHMTTGFAADILASGRCDLPTLEECFVAHRFILDELRPHFAELLGIESDRCPVT